MEFKVLTTERFEYKVVKHRIADERVQKICDNLKINPYSGKLLKYHYFREKRINGKRLYYLVYDKLRVVLMVSVSDKKGQQNAISEIKQGFEEYRTAVKKLLGKD